MHDQKTCANCNRPSIVRIVMMPGKNGKEFWLCPWCYGGNDGGHCRPLPEAYKKQPKKGRR